MDSILKATASYEAWLMEHMGEAGDLNAFDAKHRLMKEGEFPFFRATFYRWAQRWKEEAEELATDPTPRLLSIGDVHVENFGTWRDDEGRLVWGANDFDEASELAWTSDLVRLATSALLAAESNTVPMTPQEICGRISSGYRRQMEAGKQARPFILAEENPELVTLMNAARKDPAVFWDKLRTKKTALASEVPPSAQAALISALPKDISDKVEWREINPAASPPGMGSIGRRRYYAVAHWGGAWMAREAKALAPSANAWALGDSSGSIHIGTLLDNAVRSPDPWFEWRGDWLVRRLAPDAVKANFSDVDSPALDKRTAKKLFDAMGAETANIHLGGGKTAEILQDFGSRTGNNEDWLWDAAKKWRNKLRNDFTQYAG